MRTVAGNVLLAASAATSPSAATASPQGAPDANEATVAASSSTSLARGSIRCRGVSPGA